MKDSLLPCTPTNVINIAHLVLAMSTGIEATVVTNPENIEAIKWHKTPSDKKFLNLFSSSK